MDESGTIQDQHFVCIKIALQSLKLLRYKKSNFLGSHHNGKNLALFNTPDGMKLNPDNCWGKKAELITTLFALDE